MKDFIAEIKTRGYWEFTIHPSEFNQKRVQDYASLDSILRKSIVSSPGWEFPFLSHNHNGGIKRNKDSIQQIIDFEHQRECWEFFQSGLFYMIKGIPEDWRDRSSFWPADQDWKPNQKIGLFGIIMSLTNFFEFSARLSLTEAGSEKMNLKYKIGNLQNRQLYADHPRTHLPFRYPAEIPDYEEPLSIDKEELIADPLKIAKRESSEVMRRFGFNPDAQFIDMLVADTRKRTH